MVKKQMAAKRPAQDHVTPLLVSAAAGALIGAALAIYATRSKPSQWDFTVSNTYNRLSDRLEGIGGKFKEKTVQKASKKKLLWLGALSAGAIGLAAITLFSTRSGKTGHNLVDRFKEVGHTAVDGFNSIDWGSVAEQVAESVVEQINQNYGSDNNVEDEDEEEEEYERPSNNIQNIVDWAILGFNVWQNIKKRR